jgi:hypothetical protein
VAGKRREEERLAHVVEAALVVEARVVHVQVLVRQHELAGVALVVPPGDAGVEPREQDGRDHGVRARARGRAVGPAGVAGRRHGPRLVGQVAAQMEHLDVGLRQPRVARDDGPALFVELDEVPFCQRKQ